MIYMRLDLGIPSLGAWCPECSLPSLELWPVLTITDSGVSELGRVSRCANHMEANA